MNDNRIFARKNAVQVLTGDEIESVSGGFMTSGDDDFDGGGDDYSFDNGTDYSWASNTGAVSNPTNCAGPEGNPGDHAAGIYYYVEDDCGRDM